MVTSGPGATNIVTPIANAHMDSTPLVIITGQVATASIGSDAFQECDITGITMGITKHNFLIQSVHEIPRVVASAFYLATTGRPGPVLIDLPKDISQSTMEWWYPETIEELDLPGYRPRSRSITTRSPSRRELIAQSERPVLYVGGGTLKSHASHQLLAFAERTKMPGRDDAHGERRLSGFARPAPRHARHARHVQRCDGDPKVGLADRARRTL